MQRLLRGLLSSLLLSCIATLTTTQDVSSIATGYGHTCVIRGPEGGVWCWGLNGDGQLGYGDTSEENVYTPTAVVVLTGASAVSAGWRFTCALSGTASGVRCWGGEIVGELGDGEEYANVYSPPSSDVLTSVSAVASGFQHTCLILSGTSGVRCWGWNLFGQLGKGGADAFRPSSDDVLTGVAAVAAGRVHTCALMISNRGVRCWGGNLEGQLGNGDSSGANVHSPPPTDVLSGVSAVSAGSWHTCVLMMSNGGVRCWGYNYYGQLGNGDMSGANQYSPPPTDVLTGVEVVATGAAHTCVLMALNGGVRCWGWNYYGQLGNGDISGANQYSPPPTDALTGVITVVTWYAHTCVLMMPDHDRGVRCWGYNEFGQLGNEDRTWANVYSPPMTSIVFPSSPSPLSLILGLALGLGLPVMAAVLLLLYRSFSRPKPARQSQATAFSNVGVEEVPREYVNGSVMTMYHGTPMHNAASIDKEGRFRPSTGGMLGPGVYCSVQFEKAVAYARGNGVVYTLEVRVGKVKKIDRQGHPLQQTWREHGYDTAWVPRGTTDMAPSGLEENCVWDPSRIRIVGRTVIPQSGMSAV